MAMEDSYVNVNAELRRLHHGNNMYRGISRHTELFESTNDSASSSQPPPSLTRFEMADVVQCLHGARSRCFECIGRIVHQVEQSIHYTFESIFGAAPNAPKCELAESQIHGLPLRSLVSGEIYFPAFANLLFDVGLDPMKEYCFLDLGSGRGRAAVAFALLYPLSRACGVEIRVALHQIAESLTMDESLRSRIRFVQADFFDNPWFEADVILINGTGFDDSLVKRLERKLGVEAKTGAIILVLSIALRCSRLKQLMPSRRYRMGWGNASVFTYVKTN